MIINASNHDALRFKVFVSLTLVVFGFSIALGKVVVRDFFLNKS